MYAIHSVQTVGPQCSNGLWHERMQKICVLRMYAIDAVNNYGTYLMAVLLEGGELHPRDCNVATALLVVRPPVLVRNVTRHLRHMPLQPRKGIGIDYCMHTHHRTQTYVYLHAHISYDTQAGRLLTLAMS
jgi:hypothetical protein